jgi:hypothetical protein
MSDIESVKEDLREHMEGVPLEARLMPMLQAMSEILPTMKIAVVAYDTEAPLEADGASRVAVVSSMEHDLLIDMMTQMVSQAQPRH